MHIRQNFEQEFDIVKPQTSPRDEKKRLQQESTYGGYYVPEKPFSTTEDYLKFNAFIIGTKWAETYEFSDDCINNVVYSID